jgi:predicted glycosyltransferase
MRVWIDLTNSPHVLVMRPLIDIMRADGHEVEVTARDFAQTLELLDRFGIEHTAIGRHRGGHVLAKAGGSPRARSPSRAGRAGAASTSRSGTARTT